MTELNLRLVTMVVMVLKIILLEVVIQEDAWQGVVVAKEAMIFLGPEVMVVAMEVELERDQEKMAMMAVVEVPQVKVVLLI